MKPAHMVLQLLLNDPLGWSQNPHNTSCLVHAVSGIDLFVDPDSSIRIRKPVELKVGWLLQREYRAAIDRLFSAKITNSLINKNEEPITLAKFKQSRDRFIDHLIEDLKKK